MHQLALCYQRRQRFATAEQTFLKAIEEAGRVYGQDAEDRMLPMHDYGKMLHKWGHLNAADEVLAEVLARRRRCLGDDSWLTLLTVRSLAALRRAQGRLDSAEALYHEALDGLNTTLGSQDANTLSALYDLAGVVALRGRGVEAVELLTRAVRDGWAQKHRLADPEWESVRGQRAFETLATKVKERQPD
jgi:tetratricopeptide (TPR) repeat protein